MPHVTFVREREAYMLRAEALMATRERRNLNLAANTGSRSGSCDQIRKKRPVECREETRPLSGPHTLHVAPHAHTQHNRKPDVKVKVDSAA